MKEGVKLFYFAIFLVAIIAAIFSISAIVNNKDSIGWESASDIKIKIDSSDKTLIDANSLVGDSLTLSSLDVSSGTAPVSGHNADEVWVSVSGQEMTLRQARATPGLCGLNNPKTTYSTTPSTLQYHYATQVEMPSGKNLQEEINLGNVLYTNNYSKICISNTRGKIYSYQDSCNRQGNMIEDCNIVKKCEGGTVSCTNSIISQSLGGFYGGIYETITSQTCYRGDCSISSGCSETSYIVAESSTLVQQSYRRVGFITKISLIGDDKTTWAIADAYCNSPGCATSWVEGSWKPSSNCDLNQPYSQGTVDAYFPGCRAISGVYCKRIASDRMSYCGGSGSDGNYANYECNIGFDSNCNPKPDSCKYLIPPPGYNPPVYDGNWTLG